MKTKFCYIISVLCLGVITILPMESTFAQGRGGRGGGGGREIGGGGHVGSGRTTVMHSLVQ